MIARILILWLVGLGASQPIYAQLLTNNGAYVVVQPQAMLLVRGSMANTPGATLQNAGTLQLTNNFTNAGTIASTGLVLFNGTTDQILIPSGASFSRLEVNNTGSTGQNRLLISQDLSVSQVLQLTRGLIRTSPSTSITLPQGAVVQGEGPERYVQGNLRVVRTNVTGTTDFGNGLIVNPNGSALGTVTALRTAGLTTAGTSYGTKPGSTTHGIDRIWHLTSTQAPVAAVGLTFSWIADDDNGLTNFNSSQVWQQAADASWFSTTPAVDASMRSITTTATTFSSWTVSNAASPLPVELISFAAKRQGNGTHLRWATAAELQSAYFDVESSTDGQLFRRIGRLNSQGSSLQGATYELQDPNIARYAARTIYYRLRIVDTDKSEAFSPVRAVQTDEAAALAVQAFPNPFADALTIRIETAQPGQAQLELRDALGRLVWQQRVTLAAGTTTHAVAATAHLPKGLYRLTLTQGQQQQHLSLTHQ